MTLLLSDVVARSPERPSGYLEAILAASSLSSDGTTLTLPDEAYTALCRRYRPVSANLHQREAQREAAAFLLGDWLAALLQRVGIASAVARLTRGGSSCGCGARQAALNAATPRLLGSLQPYPLTLAVALSWLLLAALLTRL
jgi:hypothetical protein